MIPRKLTEASLLLPVAKYLRRRGFSLQRDELGFYEHSIDLYAFSPRRRATLAVELKLTRWRRAFEQALLYQLCADYVFVGTPDSTYKGIDHGLFRKYGIGLILVDAHMCCREAIPARRSDVMRRGYRKTYIELLQEN